MEEEIRSIEAERRRAMVAGDMQSLERIVDPDALYVHTHTLSETGSEFLELVRNGTYRYSDVRQDEMSIRLLGSDVAIVTGRTILDAILPSGAGKTVDGRSVVIWAKRGGQWRMLHYQGTMVQS